MKRNLNTLATIILTSAIITSCTTGNSSPTESGTNPPVDVPTLAGGTPNPDAPATVPASRTEQPNSPTEIPTPLKPGFGGPDNERDEFMNNTVEGKAQTEWLTKWLGYWSTAREEDRAVAPTDLGSEIARLYIKKIPGSNMLVFESPDYPGVVIVPPVWAQEGMLPPPDAEPNHEIPAGSNILTLSTTSGPELVQFGIPEGSVLVPRNGRYFMADKNDLNKAVGMVNLKTGQWESVDFSRFNYCATRAEGRGCRITMADAENGSFADFVRFHDTTNFPADVHIVPLTIMNVPPSFTYLTWAGDETRTNAELTAWYEANQDKLPNRKMAYALAANADNYDFMITVVKQIDMAGRVSFLTYRGSAKNSVVDLMATLPLFEVQNGNLGYTDPEVVPLLRTWLDTGVIPPKLEHKLLHEYNEQK